MNAALNEAQRERLFLLLFQKEFYTKREMAHQVAQDLLMVDTEASDSAALSSAEAAAVADCFQEIWPEMSRLDAVIERNLTRWRIGRLGKVELAVLRLVTYELLRCEGIRPGTVINGAVNLAKKYAGQQAGTFVNGVIRNIYEAEYRTESNNGE
ncbi:MAG: transcription antitermination factor NusB [Eubacteriales bacterium]|nr:transcription antitermination factor NusB [Eubacteriales bacterium]